MADWKSLNKVEVPPVTGKHKNRAHDELRVKKLGWKDKPIGEDGGPPHHVKDQDPPAGRWVDPGFVVTLFVFEPVRDRRWLWVLAAIIVAASTWWLLRR